MSRFRIDRKKREVVSSQEVDGRGAAGAIPDVADEVYRVASLMEKMLEEGNCDRSFVFYDEGE